MPDQAQPLLSADQDIGLYKVDLDRLLDLLKTPSTPAEELTFSDPAAERAILERDEIITALRRQIEIMRVVVDQRPARIVELGQLALVVGPRRHPATVRVVLDRSVGVVSFVLEPGDSLLLSIPLLNLGELVRRARDLIG